MNTRRAVSLLELLVVMSACSIILTLSVSLIHRVMRTQSSARSFFDRERSALRLSQQFRRDVQQAKSAITAPVDAPDGTFLLLRWNESQTVEYRTQAGVVRRTLFEKDKALSREEFTLRSEIDAAVSQDESQITLLLTTRSGDSAPPQVAGTYEKPVNLRIQARLGRDFRFAKNPDREVIE